MMNRDFIQACILKDNYLDISFSKYLKFKNHEEYDEGYKYDILTSLNNYFKEIELSTDTVVEAAKSYRKKTHHQVVSFTGATHKI